ncbi:hypothetical protein ACIRRA_41805 [Nocardia sp. NPDC101769]|uniref:hypothetical protein n=1 Tax=Nocardia sp. NPDC101769 TaxID=3364333 RepID=UPI0038158997
MSSERNDTQQALAIVGFGSATSVSAAVEAVAESFTRSTSATTSLRLGVVAGTDGGVGEVRPAAQAAFGDRNVAVTAGPDVAVEATVAGSDELGAARTLLADPAVDAVLVVASGGDVVGAVVLAVATDITANYEYARLESVEIGTAATPADAMAGATRQALERAEVASGTLEHLRFLNGTAEYVAGAVTGFGVSGPASLSCVLGNSTELGVAALVGVVADMHHASLPATPASLTAALGAIDLTGSPFCVTVVDQPWMRKQRGARRWSMLSGADRVVGDESRCTAMVITSDLTSSRHSPINWVGQRGPAIVVLRGDDGAALVSGVRVLRSAIGAGENIAAVVASSIADTTPSKYRVVLVATDADTLVRELDIAERTLAAKIDAGADWATPAGSFCTGAPLEPGGKVAFVYPGTYASYPGAERGPFQLFPCLLAIAEQFADHPFEVFGIETGYQRSTRVPSPADIEQYDRELRSDVGFIATSGVNLGLLSTSMLRDVLGIVPDGAFGYSMGEICMLFAFDVWQLHDRFGLNVRHSEMFASELYGARTVVRNAWDRPADTPDSEVWATFALAAPLVAVRAAVSGRERVYITHINTASEVVIAGDPGQCVAIVKALDCPAVSLPGGGPVLHVPLVDSVHDSIAAVLTGSDLGTPSESAELAFAAAGAGVDLHDRSAIAEAIHGLCRSEVDFPQLCVDAYDRGFRYFIEVGPGADCTRWIDANLAGRPHVAVSIDRKGSTQSLSLAKALARLISFGLPVDLTRLFPVDSAVRSGDIDEHRAESAETTAEDVELVPLDGDLAGDGETIRFDSEVGYPEADLGDLYEVRVADSGHGHRPAEIPSGSVVVPAIDLGTRQTIPSPELSPKTLPVPVRALRRVEPVVARTAGRLAVSAVAVAQAQVAALDAQGALMNLMLRDLEQRSGLHVAPQSLPADPFAPAVIGVVDGDDGESRTVITEFDWRDTTFMVDGRIGTAALLESLVRAVESMKPWLVGDDAASAWTYVPVETATIFHAPLPESGTVVRTELRFAPTGSGQGVVEFQFSGTIGTADLVIAEIAAGRGEVREQVSARPLSELAPIVRKPSTLRRRGFKPLEHTGIENLSGHQLRQLAEGRIVDVFGPRWDQRADGCNRAIRISPNRTPMLSDVTEIVRRGGEFRLGALVAGQHIRENAAWRSNSGSPRPAAVSWAFIEESARELLRIYALYLGLHLVFADAEFGPAAEVETVVATSRPVTDADGKLRYTAEITDVAMIPRPAVIANIHVWAGSELVATYRDLAVEVRERPGSDFRPDMRDGKPVFLGRVNSRGEAAILNEFHLSHMENGDLGIALGPVVDSYTGKTVLHIPNSEFRFVDRIMSVAGDMDKLRSGRMVSEYDAATESWYYEDNSFPGMPGSIIMESSLQSAAVLGSCLGTTMKVPLDVKLSVRNLDGTATVLADIDVRGKTLRQTTNLVSTTHIAGQILQRFRYVMEADGVPYYEGQSLFGYFTEEALNSQIGLDGGKEVPLWLDTQQRNQLAEVREIDFTVDKSWYEPHPETGLYIGSGHFRMLDSAVVVPGGGRNGRGHLKATRQVEPDDWYFDCHFHEDPVMPGSLGVEAVMQGLQTYVMATDLAAGLGKVRFGLATGVPFTWTYRGQILQHEKRMDLELDVTEVRETPQGLLVLADASIFKPGMRIYHLQNVAVAVERVDSKGTQG